MSSPQLSGVDYLHKGYRYWFARQGESDAFWYCCKRAASCQARLLTSLKSGDVAEEMNGHNHPPTESPKTNGVVASTKETRPVRGSPTNSNDNADRLPAVTKLASRLRHKGYVFHYDRTPTSGSKRYWRCKDKFTSRCTARLHTAPTGKVLLEVGEHSHPPYGPVKPSPKKASPSLARNSSTSESCMRYKNFAFQWDHQTSKDGTKRYWHCKQKRNTQCLARIHTTAGGAVLKEVGEHNHPPTFTVTKKEPGCTREDTPKSSHSSKRRTLSANREQPSKKRRISEAVDSKKSSAPSSATASSVDSSSTPSTFTVIQRMMSLPLAKRASAALLFSSLLDEMESDVKTEQ